MCVCLGMCGMDVRLCIFVTILGLTLGVDPGIFNRGAGRGAQTLFRREAMAPGCQHTVRRPVSAKIGGCSHVSAKIRGACTGAPPLNPPLGYSDLVWIWVCGSSLNPIF